MYSRKNCKLLFKKKLINSFILWQSWIKWYYLLCLMVLNNAYICMSCKAVKRFGHVAWEIAHMDYCIHIQLLGLVLIHTCFKGLHLSTYHVWLWLLHYEVQDIHSGHCICLYDIFIYGCIKAIVINLLREYSTPLFKPDIIAQGQHKIYSEFYIRSNWSFIHIKLVYYPIPAVSKPYKWRCDISHLLSDQMCCVYSSQ